MYETNNPKTPRVTKKKVLIAPSIIPVFLKGNEKEMRGNLKRGNEKDSFGKLK